MDQRQNMKQNRGMLPDTWPSGSSPPPLPIRVGVLWPAGWSRSEALGLTPASAHCKGHQGGRLTTWIQHTVGKPKQHPEV